MKKHKLSTGDLDYIVSQLQQAQEETASTLAIKPVQSIKLPKTLAPSIKTWFMGILVGILLVLAGFTAWHVFTKKAATLKTGTAVENIQKLATLATAQEHVKTIISQQDNKLFGKTINLNLPGTKRTVFLVVPAEVTAGVNLKQLTQKDVTLDPKEKTIHITLPHATIVQDPSLDLKNIETFSNEGVLRGTPDMNSGFQLADLTKQQVKQDAVKSGLLKTAEDNAQQALQDFFSNLGYTVKVTFK